MKLSAWRVALRIARRDALRAKGRSALVVAMIALPVLGVATADITFRSAELSARQSADRLMGASSAFVSAHELGLPLLQAPNPDAGTSSGDDRKLTAEQKARAQEPVGQLLKEALPAGATTVQVDDGTFARVSTKYGVDDVQVSGLDLSDPIFRGMVTLRQGTVPSAPFQVAVTSQFLSDSGLHLGSTTTVNGSAQPLTITAVVEFPNALRDARLVGRPQDMATVLPSRSTDHNYNGEWLVTLPGNAAFSWTDVQRTNQYGFTVASRAVLADPPPRSEVPYDRGSGDSGSSIDTETVTILATVVGMALLEIVLLAGPAFAVGARRSRRQLGLLAAAGGNRAHIRNVVLGGGVVLGGTGALIGIVVAAAAVAIGRGSLEWFVGQRFGAFTLQPLDLIGIVGVGLVTGLLAAIVPAVQASRQNVLASLTGRGDVKAPSKRLTVVGAIVVALGTALALLGAGMGGQTAAIMGGSMIAELGLVACIPFLVGLFGRLSRWLPLGPRLALRDSTRHRGRTAPAVAAVMAAVAGAVAVTAYQGSSDVEYRAQYQASAPRNAVMLQQMGSGFGPGPAAGSATALGQQNAAVEQSIAGLGPRGDVSAVVVPGADCQGDHSCGYVSTVLPADRVCPVEAVDAKGEPLKKYSSAEIRAMVKDDPRCRQDRGSISYSSFGSIVAGDATVLHNLTGRTDPAAAAALAAGKVLVSDPRYIENGKVVLTVEITGNGSGSGSAGQSDTTRTVTAPAAPFRAEPGSPEALMGPATAQALGLAAVPSGSVWLPDQAPDSAAQQRAAAAVSRIGDGSVTVERGYQGTNSAIAIILALVAAVVAVAAAGIATGLAAADSQADLATLAAVGAAPRIRRTLSGFQCAVIATMGAILGAAAGLVPAAALWGVHSSDMSASYSATDGTVSIPTPTTPLDVPWGTMALVVVGLPLLAWLLAAGLTRSRVVLTRRIG